MSIIKGFEKLLFPNGLRCGFCNAVSPSRHEVLCVRCRNEINELVKGLSYCRKCGRFLPKGEDLCPECAFGNKFSFVVARAVAPYKGILKEKIHLFKYLHKRTLAEPLGMLMVKKFREEKAYGDIDAVIAVPLHENRLEERTFNQAEELAKIIAKKIKREYLVNGLWRAIDTPTQVTLHRREREKNLKNAFAVPDKAMIEDKRLLLIDDIFTTGATARECTNTLLQAGAKSVAVLTLATGIIPRE